MYGLSRLKRKKTTSTEYWIVLVLRCEFSVNSPSIVHAIWGRFGIVVHAVWDCCVDAVSLSFVNVASGSANAVKSLVLC
ncbi:hypothetical protein KY289_019612 [Solanum tuberosum]|nr:hypothetical protein KY289_019612 [Solanum tuberosum]